jgi:hypothetical protein
MTGAAADIGNHRLDILGVSPRPRVIRPVVAAADELLARRGRNR